MIIFITETKWDNSLKLRGPLYGLGRLASWRSCINSETHSLFLVYFLKSLCHPKGDARAKQYPS